MAVKTKVYRTREEVAELPADLKPPSPLPLPGFVDLQVNGFLGVDFSDPNLTEEAFAEAARSLFSRGTAAFLPTVITGPEEMYERNLPLIARAIQTDEFRGRLLGIHVEGPFISPQPGAAGAHPRSNVCLPETKLFEKMMEWANGCIKLLTLAAELPGAETVARQAKAAGITVSIGHSLAAPEDLERLAKVGANVVTHLGNGLPNLLPRHENFIWNVLADDGYAAMVIADGHHLPAPVLKSIIRAKTVDRIIVVSDASPIAGLPPGRYNTLGNNAVLEPSGRVYNFETQCLVGSSATMRQCMNHLARLGFLTLDELIAVGFKNPLKLIGMSGENLKGDSLHRLYYDSERRLFTVRPPDSTF